MKKLLSLVLSLALVCGALVGLTACGDSGNSTGGEETKLKVGLICLHNSDSTYDKNFIDAFEYACKKKGVDYIIKTDVPEDEKCSAAAEDLVDQGCDIIFSDSYGHQGFMKGVAAENPKVVFCSATGDTAHTDGLSNFYNAFASIYEGRFLAGIAAGEKLKEMLAENKLVAKNYNEAGKVLIGYVGAYTYAEVKSGYTSWFLGLRSIVPTATMEVKFTSSWYDYDEEKSAAEALIQSGCVLISQHADSMGAPDACAAAGVPNVCYNVDSRTMTQDAKVSDSYIIASKINWAPYFRYMIDCVKNGVEIDYDWTGTFATGSVELLALNEKVAAAGTQEKLAEVKAQLIAGTLKVFDCSKFTVSGKNITEYLADVDDKGDYKPETQVIKTSNGITYFAESEFRAAPYFDIDIDGITLPKA